MFITTKEGFKINYFMTRKKNKPFIIFLHGLAGDHSEFTHQINVLKNNYSILAFDMLGHGKSDKPLNKIYYKSDYGVKIIIDFLKKNKIINPIIVGFSMGGFLACKISEKIKIKKLILINPAFGIKSISLFFLIGEFFSRFMPKFFLKLLVKSYKIYEYNGLLDEYAKMLLQTPAHVHKAIIENARYEKIPKVKQKAYLIKSKNDEIVNNYLPLENYEKFTAKGFHLVHVQNHEEITKIIQRILNK
ncbi:MAG: alpha/beta hydrolase [Candidatus Nanoarchaeia archaeon]|nr:alpha/beta hydrolase [Candidatus Nanoarchaeia archaeon]